MKKMENYVKLEAKFVESLIDDVEILVVTLPSGDKARHIIRKSNKFSDMLDVETAYKNAGYRLF